MQQRQELRHDALHGVGHEHLVAIELDLVAVQVEVALDAGEIEDTRQFEGIIHIQVDPEERLLAHRIEVLVELLIVLLLQLRRFADPGRGGVVDDVVLVGIHIFTILPLLLLAESDRNRKEAAILLQQPLQLLLVQEVLVLIVDVEDDVGASVGLLGLLHGVLRCTVAAPLHGRSILVRLGDDLHLLRYHE